MGAASSFEPEVTVTHIPVRVEDDAVRWDVVHTLVVATQTVNSPELVAHLKKRAAERPHRYTIISPRSGEISREEVCRRVASTLAELYRAEIDATGQPMSPEPYAAVVNAIEHYRIDEILISTFAGSKSKWLEEGLVEKVKERSPDKPVEHFEVGGDGSRDEPTREPARGRSRGELMESASVAVDHHHHGPPEAHQSSRIDRQTLGILLFIVSEVMLFGAFFASYFFLRVVADEGKPWPPEGFELPGRRRGRQHGHPRLVELHGPLGARVGEARQPPRDDHGPRARPSCSARRSSSSRSTSTSTSASAPATRPSARSSTASPASTAPTSPSA